MARICDGIMKDLRKGNVVLRRDYEPAITSLLDEVCRARAGTRTITDKSSIFLPVRKGLAESELFSQLKR